MRALAKVSFATALALCLIPSIASAGPLFAPSNRGAHERLSLTPPITLWRKTLPWPTFRL